MTGVTSISGGLYPRAGSRFTPVLRSCTLHFLKSSGEHSEQGDRMCYSADYFINPAIIRWWNEKAKHWGPLIAGALFGAGWWFWADAVALSEHKVPAAHYLPGIIATLALVMINFIRRDELTDIDPFDDAAFCRARIWLFISYVVSFSSVVAAVWVMIQSYSSKPDLTSAEKWPGAAGIFQVSFILGSGLLFFISRTPGGSGSYEGYGAF